VPAEETSDLFGPVDEAQPAMSTDELDWRHSFACGTHGSCVEIAKRQGGGVAIRDGKAGEASPVLTFSREEWDAFIEGVKAGDFE
jgi:hypothetical protein